MALAEAREVIACDHFTSALSDPDFALKVKERAPKSLDEALSVAVRLEAWEKSVGHPRQNEDRSDRPRQKARVAGKSETAKESQGPKPDPQVAELRAEVTRLSEELKRLSEKPIPPTEATDTRKAPARNPYPVRVQGTKANASAGKASVL